MNTAGNCDFLGLNNENATGSSLSTQKMMKITFSSTFLYQICKNKGKISHKLLNISSLKILWGGGGM